MFEDYLDYKILVSDLFQISNFELVSYFGFSVSDFGYLAGVWDAVDATKKAS